MAKQRFGINDAYRGTVGTVIGYEWRGRWCLRAKPLRVRNPRTVKQQNNRLLFKQMVRLASSMKMVLRKGLRKRSLEQHMTECNQFVKYNKECFSLDGGQRMVVDWERLIISEGSVAVPVFSAPDTLLSQPSRAASSPNSGEQLDSKDRGSSSPSKLEGVDAKRTGACVQEATIAVPFAPHAEGERASGNDEVYIYVYCPEREEGVLSAPAYRKTGRVSLELPDRWQGKTVHLYGFAVDDRGEASETTYIGRLEAHAITGDGSVDDTQHVVSQNDIRATNEDYGSRQATSRWRFLFYGAVG